MATALGYAIKFVDDMDAAIAFHRDRLGLPLRFQSPHWTEFETGSTTLALHLASPENRAGTVQLGFRVDDVDQFCAAYAAAGIRVSQPPADLHGQRLAKIVYPDGSEFSVSSPARG